MCFTHHKDLAWMIEIFFLFKYILSALRPSWLHVFCFLFWRLGLCYDIIYIKSQVWLTLISSFNSFCEHNAHLGYLYNFSSTGTRVTDYSVTPALVGSLLSILCKL